MTKKELALLAVEALKKEYPDAICSLEYQDPLQLLISTRLSAQCTDARVNLVTPALFARFPTLAACRMIRDEFGGRVPDTIEELTRLPGVGRKTANLVVGDIYGKPAVVTDTHCIRITGRLGLTKNTAPAKVEDDLRAVLPPEESNDFCHRLVLHGRAVCTARKAMCENCCMQEFCKKSGLNPPAKKTAAKKNKEQSKKA